ncbi:MAG: FAD-dependent oxidoreductase [Bacteroidetes bacterium]|nr:MAG: FAD-dependent oxidoreductase [Bacteroidota bacterium]
MLKTNQWSYWERKEILEEIDLVIVGAGIVGYSTALAFQENNPTAKILVVERGLLPSGASTKNAGFACFGSASEIYDDIQSFGEDTVWKTVELRWKGLQALRNRIGDKDLKLHMNGSWDLFTESEMDTFEAVSPQITYYNEQLEEITGERNVFSIDSDVQQQFGFNHIETSIYNRLEGQIDTGSMMTRFHQLVVSTGIRVLFGCEVDSIHEKENGAVLHTHLGSIESQKVAVCTNGFARHLLKEDVEPARAQVLITKPIEGLKINGTFHYQKGYFYFRNIDNRILFGGGRNLAFEEEKTSTIATSERIMHALHEILSEVILPKTAYEVDHSWAGIMGVGSVKKPIIKHISPSVYCGIRLGGMGVAIGSLVGEELAKMISTNEE